MNILFKEYAKQNINFIIDYSLGVFIGFYLSKLMQIPTLLFSLALPNSTSVLQNILIVNGEHEHFLQIVIGNQDDLIPVKDNLDFILN